MTWKTRFRDYGRVILDFFKALFRKFRVKTERTSEDKEGAKMGTKYYPPDLIVRIKKEYPDNPALHGALESGNHYILNRELKPRLLGFTAFEVLEAFEKNRAEQLRKKCVEHKRRLDLYYEWCVWDFGEKSQQR